MLKIESEDPTTHVMRTLELPAVKCYLGTIRKK